MKWFCLITGFALVMLLQKNTSAEDPKDEPKAKTIPLDQIWAYRMPGTKEVLQLEPKQDAKNMTEEEVQQYFRTSSIQQILHALASRPREKRDELAGPAFVVAGTGKEALKNAAAVFATKETKWPEDQLPANTDLSLVFYSYQSSQYLRIVSVDQTPRSVTVTYQPIRHRSMLLSNYFALIPLGKLPEGSVTVRIVGLPLIDEQNHHVTPWVDPHKRVCNGSTFGVRK